VCNGGTLSYGTHHELKHTAELNRFSNCTRPCFIYHVFDKTPFFVSGTENAHQTKPYMERFWILGCAF